MNANEKFIAADAHVDAAAIAPLPNSRKIYVAGSRPDIRVPMREIAQSATADVPNPPITVYDCSGPSHLSGRFQNNNIWLSKGWSSKFSIASATS